MTGLDFEIFFLEIQTENKRSKPFSEKIFIKSQKKKTKKE